MATAGRATLFSGLTVAIGLALLVFMPLPFMRSMGAGGVLIPLVSIAASATLLPALLSLHGHAHQPLPGRPAARARTARARRTPGVWSRLATRSCATRSLFFVRLGRRSCSRSRAGARPAPDQRRQPRLAADHRGDARPPRARGDGRAGRARAASDRRRHAPAGRRRTARDRRRPAPPVAELRADPRDRAATIQAPVRCRRRAALPGRPAGPERPASCRYAPPATPTPARQTGAGAGAHDPRPLHPGGRFPARRRCC